MHKFFVERNNIKDNIVLIENQDAKHISKILRLKTDDQISINDCNGSEYIAKISEINKDNVKAKITEKLVLSNESPVNIYLFQGLPKASKMDLIIQKCVEIGAFSIVPVITKRVVVKSELKEFKKIDRWKKIAIEACKQSKRSLIPSIEMPMEFNDLLAKLDDMDIIFVPYENEQKNGIKSVLTKVDKAGIKNIGIIVGPEGGFEESEVQKLIEKGAYSVTLGPRILRTETAGFVMASILQYEFGDMGGKLI